MISIEPFDGVTKGLEKAQYTLDRSIVRYLDRAAQEVAVEEKRLAPKAFSILLNSIGVMVTGTYERFVGPSVNYARAVEEGTGPAAGKKRYFPSWIYLAPWIKQRTGVTFTQAWGSAGRRSEERDVRDRAWALARFISIHGTKPHPFVAPAVENMRSRVIDLLDEGVKAGIAEAFGGGGVSAEITAVMEQLKTSLGALYPQRKVTRDLLDFNDRPEAHLKAGIYTLIAGQEDNFPNYLHREGNYGTLHLVVVGQVLVDAKTPPVPSDVEDAENLMIDEIKAFTRSAPPSPIDSIILKSDHRSQQLEYPYGWVAFDMELTLQ